MSKKRNISGTFPLFQSLDFIVALAMQVFEIYLLCFTRHILNMYVFYQQRYN